MCLVGMIAVATAILGTGAPVDTVEILEREKMDMLSDNSTPSSGSSVLMLDGLLESMAAGGGKEDTSRIWKSIQSLQLKVRKDTVDRVGSSSDSDSLGDSSGASPGAATGARKLGQRNRAGVADLEALLGDEEVRFEYRGEDVQREKTVLSAVGVQDLRLPRRSDSLAFAEVLQFMPSLRPLLILHRRRNAEVSRYVDLKLEITPEGDVANAWVHNTRDGEFAQAIEAKVRVWKFQPVADSAVFKGRFRRLDAARRNSNIVLGEIGN